MDPSEEVAYTTLRLAIPQSAYDGSGEISSEKLDTLKSIVKNFNKNKLWFDDYESSLSGVTKDNSDN